MRVHRTAVVLAIIGVVLVWIACLVPLQQSGGFQYTDKFEHAAAYLLQTLTLTILFPRFRWQIMVWFLCQGAVIEGLQSITSYRSAEMADMAANTIGVVLGLSLSYTPLALRLSRRINPDPT